MPLQKRVVGEINTWHHIPDEKATCSVSAKKLSTLRSSTSRPTMRSGKTSSGIIFGGVQNVEIEVVCKLLVEELKTEFPLRKIAVVNCMPQIPAVKVRIGS